MKNYQTIRFHEGVLSLIDQRKIPGEESYFQCRTVDDVVEAIQTMVVRGAPAIGATAAYGMLIGAMELSTEANNVDDVRVHLFQVKKKLDASRPTAVNLMWATEQMIKASEGYDDNSKSAFFKVLKEQADAIYQKDIESCNAMADYGNTLIPQEATLLTHCNTGPLATVDIGTALGVLVRAHQSGKKIHVYADETRPRLQGAKLTAWELMKESVPTTLIADSVAATLIRDGKIDAIFVGADRIAANGDTANKIGTFMLSALAHLYKVPFYIVAPLSTVDFKTLTGEGIEIEEREAEELTHMNGVQVAPEGVNVYNPAFDVTPHEYITAIVTDKGIVKPPFKEGLSNLEV